MLIRILQGFVLLSFFCKALWIDAASNPPQYNRQDQPNLSVDNPMKGLSTFLFFPMGPPVNKKNADQILEQVGSALARMGSVERYKMLIQTENGEEIDLHPLATSATLIYQLDDIRDVFGKELGIVRASLNLTTGVQVEATKQVSYPYIWSCNCFIKGSVKKNGKRLVDESLEPLLNQFHTVFMQANTTAPIFKLQTSGS